MPTSPEPLTRTLRAYARGIAGGLLVAMPLLATMEMWWIGFYMAPWKLLLFLLFNYGILLILEYYSGFRRFDEVSLFEEARDAVVAYGLGYLAAALVLFVLRLLHPGMALQEMIGKVALQAIPVSQGVSVAVAQFGEESTGKHERKETTGFWGKQAVALAGGLIFGFNIAPTIEPMLLGLRMSGWSGLLLLLLSVVQVHAVVYYTDFRSSSDRPTSPEAVLMSSVTTYVLALLLAGYLLWTFDRIGVHTGFAAALHMTLALGFVTSLGAAAGKVLL